MDWMLFMIVFGAGLALGAVTLVMLNRAWGDFPGKTPRPPGAPPAAPGSNMPVYARSPEPSDSVDQPELPAGAPAEGLIPVTHPGVRRAVESTITRGGSPYATYFVRDGDQIYLAAYRIADPLQREQIVRAFQALNTGDTAGISPFDLLQTLARLGRS